MPGDLQILVLQYQMVCDKPTLCPVDWFFDDHSFFIVTASMKYKDLPSTLRRTVKRSLSHDGSWLKLATCLGRCSHAHALSSSLRGRRRVAGIVSLSTDLYRKESIRP